MLKTGEAKYREELDLLAEYEGVLEQGTPLRRTSLPGIPGLPLLSAKPVMYVLNTDEGMQQAPAEFLEWAAGEGAEVITMAAQFERELTHLDAEEAKLFLEDLGMDKPALHRLVGSRRPSPRSDHLLHHQRRRNQGLDYSPGNARTPGSGAYSH